MKHLYKLQQSVSSKLIYIEGENLSPKSGEHSAIFIPSAEDSARISQQIHISLRKITEENPRQSIVPGMIGAVDPLIVRDELCKQDIRTAFQKLSLVQKQRVLRKLENIIGEEKQSKNEVARDEILSLVEDLANFLIGTTEEGTLDYFVYMKHLKRINDSLNECPKHTAKFLAHIAEKWNTDYRFREGERHMSEEGDIVDKFKDYIDYLTNTPAEEINMDHANATFRIIVEELSTIYGE